MSKPVVWTAMASDREITDTERAAIEAILTVGSEDGEPIGESENRCEHDHVLFGWSYYDDAEKARNKIVALTPDISWRVVLDWDERDSPGEEVLYFGQKALELEIEDIEEELLGLEDRKTRLHAAIAARDA